MYETADAADTMTWPLSRSELATMPRVETAPIMDSSDDQRCIYAAWLNHYSPVS